jgi:hypothetical protein
MRAANDVSLDFAAEYLAQLILEIKYPKVWQTADFFSLPDFAGFDEIFTSTRSFSRMQV